MTFAELYDAAFGWDPADELASLEFVWNRTLGGIPKDVCEVGPGPGRFAIPLLRRGIRYTGFEPTADMAEVLVRKVSLLPSEARNRFTLNEEPYEENRGPNSTFDSIILMTDTVSYVWPQKTLARLARKVRSSLRAGGVVVLDIGLWAGFEGERREESWTEEANNLTVSATCIGTLVPLAGRGGDELARLEELSFRGKSKELRLYASQQKILHAFTFDGIRDFWQELGFGLALCVVPGGREEVAEDDRGKRDRLLLAFHHIMPP